MTEKKTILIVDDQESVIKSLKRLLLTEAYNILSAPDGPSALEIIRQHMNEIFLIISDQRMPHMTGSMFLEKTLEMLPDAIRFILSGYAERENAVNALNQGVVHRYIAKPWDSNELLIMIRQAYESPDKVRALVTTHDYYSHTAQEPNIMEMEVRKFDEQRKDRSLGRVALHHGFINQEQLDASLTAMQIERQAGREVSLENILFEKGFISSETMGKLVAVTRRKIGTTFGKAAMTHFGLSQSDIDRCLAIQAQEFSTTTTCRLLGDILVAEKILTEEQKESIIVDMIYSEKEILTSDGDAAVKEKRGDGSSSKKEDVVNKNSMNRHKRQFLRQRAFDKIFCKATIKRNFATESEILKALEEQLLHFSKTLETRFVRDILVANSMISQLQAEIITAAVGPKHIHSTPVDAEAKSTAAPLMKMSSKETAPVNVVSGSDLPSVKTAGVAQPHLQSPVREEDSSTHNKKILIGKNSAFELTLTAEEMEAQIRLVGDMPEETTVEQLKALLSRHQIIYGLADDVAIELFLQRAATKKAEFTIAKGKPIKPGRNALIKYFFEDENRLFGRELDSGKFDYRERGEIQTVTQGRVLAEKIPLIPAVNGITVTGNQISAPVPVDMNLDCGKGAELSKDGLKAVAAANGRPDLSLGGRISVMPEKIIKGNVDFNTGNIKFSGDIVIHGTILTGFSVTGNNLTVNDIQDAEVNIANNIIVKNSINSSTVRSGGHLVSKIITKSTVFACGDVVVQKEIIDCNIITSGKVIVPRGRVVASTIHAAKGIEALNIGSEVSSPCHLHPGADDHALGTLKVFADKIDSYRENMIKLEALQNQFDQQSLQQLTNLSEISKLQEELLLERKNILKQRAAATDEIVKREIDTSLDDIEKRAVKMDETVNRLFDEQDTTQNKVRELKSKIELIKKQQQIVLNEKKGFEAWYEGQKRENIKNGEGGVLVHGTLFADTQITEAECSKTVKSNVRNVRVYKVMNSEHPGNPFYEMRVDSLSSRGSQPHVYRT